jgi:hypothetical protein
MRPSSRSPFLIRFTRSRQIVMCLFAGACSLLAVQPSAANTQVPDREASSLEVPAQQAPAQQTVVAEPPPLGTVLRHDESGTTVVRRDRAVAASAHVPLTAGDIVRTDAGASATIVLANETVLMMLEGTEIEMRGPHRLRLRDGYVTVLLDDWPRLLSLAPPDNGSLLTIDVPHGVVTLMSAGDYDLDVEARTPSTSSALISVHAGRAGLTALQTAVSGRDSLDKLTARSLNKGQAGLLRAGAAPSEMTPALSPHRVATERFVKLTRSLRDFRTRTQTVFKKFPDVSVLHAWLLDGYGMWMWDAEEGTNWTPHVEPGDLWWGWYTQHHGRWRIDPFGRPVWVPGHAWSDSTNVTAPRTPGSDGVYPTGTTDATGVTGALGRREAEEAAVRKWRARDNAARTRYAWEQYIAVERERQLEDAEERARAAREERLYTITIDDDAPPRHGSYSSSSDGYSSSSSSGGSGGSSNSSSSSGSRSASGSSGSGAVPRDSSGSSSSSGAVPRDTSGPSKAPPRHGSRP